MAYTVPPPARPQYKETMQNMRPRTDVFFPGAAPESLKSIASRLSVGGKRYITAKVEDGVRVWRTA